MTVVSQQALFDAQVARQSQGPEICDWLPDETLFSLCSRHHLLSANGKSSDTCHQLFGHYRTGSAHDLPVRVAQFVSRTAGRFGSVTEVIRRHTLLPFYLPFRSQKGVDDAIAGMASDAAGSLKASLGILATRFGAAHPLKACPRCCLLDRQLHGVSYWHVEHQLPGAWICIRHGDLLSLSTLKGSGVDRFGWYLPDHASLMPCFTKPLSSAALATLRSIATGARAIWALPRECHLDLHRLSEMYTSAMKEHGFASASGRIHTALFDAAVVGLTGPLIQVRELSCLPHQPNDGATQFIRVVGHPDRPTHPLRHLILAELLFGGWSSLWTAYQGFSTRPDETQEVEPSRLGPIGGAKPDAAKRSLVLGDLFKGHISRHALADKHGVAVSTVMAWAAAAGLENRRRSKLLKPPVREQLITALAKGIDKAPLAQSLGISIQTVTTTLRTEAGLHSRWKQARFDAALESARKAWQTTASRLAFATPKLMRAMQPAIFAWLYRNDRAWLEAFAVELPRAPKSNYACVNWDARDQAMSQRIKQTALDWRELHANQRFTIGKLCQVMPDLKALLSKLDRMPLCRAALSNISARRSKEPYLI
jgi:Tn7-like transposition protein D/TniQ